MEWIFFNSFKPVVIELDSFVPSFSLIFDRKIRCWYKSQNWKIQSIYFPYLCLYVIPSLQLLATAVHWSWLQWSCGPWLVKRPRVIKIVIRSCSGEDPRRSAKVKMSLYSRCWWEVIWKAYVLLCVFKRRSLRLFKRQIKFGRYSFEWVYWSVLIFVLILLLLLLCRCRRRRCYYLDC